MTQNTKRKVYQAAVRQVNNPVQPTPDRKAGQTGSNSILVITWRDKVTNTAVVPEHSTPLQPAQNALAGTRA